MSERQEPKIRRSLQIDDAKVFFSQFPQYPEAVPFFELWTVFDEPFSDILQYCPEPFIQWACGVLELAPEWERYQQQVAKVNELLADATATTRQLALAGLRRSITKPIMIEIERRMEAGHAAGITG